MPIQLADGLTVHAEEDPAAPVVAIQIWVQVGSADEAPDEAGLAHLHEHLLLKGTRTRGRGDAAQIIDALGGELDAWTSFDQTVFRVNLASRFWQTGLEVLAEAVSAAVLDPELISRELDSVCEELERSDESPGRAVSEALFDVAYEEHLYGLPLFGTEASIRAHTPEGIARFYRRWYRPGNMVVVVAGDVREAEVLEAARRCFHFDAGARVDDPAVRTAPRVFVRPIRSPEPEHIEPRARVQRRSAREAQLTLAWPAPARGHDDVPALDALALVLGHGEQSRLFRAMKRDRPLVSELHASCYTPRDRGLAMLSFTLPADNLREAVREAAEQLYRLRVEEVGPDEWERARRQLESDAIHQRETPHGRAGKLGLSLSSTGGLEQEARYFARLAAATPRTARDAARRWFDPKGMVGAAVLPTDADESFEFESFQQLLEEIAAAALDPEAIDSSPPRSFPTRSQPTQRVHRGAPGALTREHLPGGGVLLIRGERAVPLIALRAVWRGGQRAESAADAGAQMLLARLAGKGTAARGAEPIARQLEELGVSIGGSAGRSSFSLRAEALSRHFAPAWELFAEAIRSPQFPPAEVERERLRQRDELRARDANPAGAAFQLFVETLYTRHPYRLDILGSEESLGRLDGAKLSAIRASLYPSGAPVIAVVGDVDPAEIRARVLESLGNPAAAAPKLAPPREPIQTRPRAAVRALEAAQAHLVLGFSGLSIGAPDCEVLEVLTAILSGPGGRLFLELRDRQRLARNPGAFSMEGVEPGWFAVHVDCDPNQVREALTGLREQLERLREDRPSVEELVRAQGRLIGSQALSLQLGAARAAQLAFDECHGLGAEWSRSYADRISAVTASRVRALAGRLFAPELANLALIAPRASLPEELVAQARETLALRNGHGSSTDVQERSRGAN